MKVNNLFKRTVIVPLAVVLGVAGSVLTTAPASAATDATLAPGTGKVRVICESGRKYQTIVEVANVAGINTNGVTFNVTDAFGANKSITRNYSTANVQAKFPQTSAGTVSAYAQYVTNNDTALHNVDFNGQQVVSVKVKACF